MDFIILKNIFKKVFVNHSKYLAKVKVPIDTCINIVLQNSQHPPQCRKYFCSYKLVPLGGSADYMYTRTCHTKLSKDTMAEELSSSYADMRATRDKQEPALEQNRDPDTENRNHFYQNIKREPQNTSAEYEEIHSRNYVSSVQVQQKVFEFFTLKIIHFFHFYR